MFCLANVRQVSVPIRERWGHSTRTLGNIFQLSRRGKLAQTHSCIIFGTCTFKGEHQRKRPDEMIKQTDAKYNYLCCPFPLKITQSLYVSLVNFLEKMLHPVHNHHYIHISLGKFAEKNVAFSWGDL